MKITLSYVIIGPDFVSIKVDLEMEKLAVTSAGKTKLEVELKKLMTVDRPEVIQAIGEAREHGDLSENAEYHAARERQGFIEGRIQEINGILNRIEVINIGELSGDRVMFGATVTIIDESTEEEKTYTIVGETEADLSQGFISNTSPVGRSLIGKSEGDNVEATTPNGIKYYEILKVEYIEQ